MSAHVRTALDTTPMNVNALDTNEDPTIDSDDTESVAPAPPELRVAMVSINTDPFSGRPSSGPGRQQHEYVARLALSLAALGHPVTVHTVAEGGRRAARSSGDVAIDEVGRAAAADASCLELLEQAKDHSERLLQSWSAHAPDVVYAHTWRSGVAAQIAAREIGVPVVQTFYGVARATRDLATKELSPDQRARLRLAAALGRSSDRVIGLSSADIDALVRMGVGRARTRLVPYGIDLDKVPTAVPAPENDGPLRVLALRSIEGACGLDDAQWVAGKLHDIDLMVGCVEPAEELDRLMDRADVVLALSEGDDMVEPALQAMALGRPVVGVSGAAVSDAVVDGVTGLLVPPRDPVGLLRALLRLSTDRCEVEAMGQAANDRVATRYPWQRIADQSLAVLTEAVG